jgi:hypothetical protein
VDANNDLYSYDDEDELYEEEKKEETQPIDMIVSHNVNNLPQDPSERRENNDHSKSN